MCARTCSAQRETELSLRPQPRTSLSAAGGPCARLSPVRSRLFCGPRESCAMGSGGGGYGVLEAASDTVSSLYSWLLSLCCSTSCSTSSVTVNGRSLRVVRQLAEGGFSFVFLVDAGGGEKFALKKVLTQLPEQAEAARWEIKVHSSIQHPNVMPLIDHCVVPAANGAEEFRLLSARSAELPNPLVCLSPAAELLLLLLLPSPFALTAASPPNKQAPASIATRAEGLDSAAGGTFLLCQARVAAAERQTATPVSRHERQSEVLLFWSSFIFM